MFNTKEKSISTNRSRDLALWDNVRDNWNSIGRVFDDIDKMMDRFFLGHGESLLPSLNVSNYFPRLDIIQFEDSLEVSVETPGIKKEDINVNLEDGVLKISGKKEKTHKEREEEREEERENEGSINPLVSERYFGYFERSLSLPVNILEDSVDASYNDGVLKLVFKLQKDDLKPKAKKIELK